MNQHEEETEHPPVELFLSHFCHVLDHSADGKVVSKYLLIIISGDRRVWDYALEFRNPTESNWNNISLQAVFPQELNKSFLKELACRYEALDSLIDLAICLDNAFPLNPCN